MRERLLAFVAERFPFAMAVVREAIGEGGSIEEMGRRVRGVRLQPDSAEVRLKPDATYETTPGVSIEQRLAQASDELVAECEGFLRREAIRASLTPDERREILRGMLLTRATDNRLRCFSPAAR